MTFAASIWPRRLGKGHFQPFPARFVCASVFCVALPLGIRRWTAAAKRQSLQAAAGAAGVALSCLSTNFRQHALPVFERSSAAGDSCAPFSFLLLQARPPQDHSSSIRISVSIRALRHCSSQLRSRRRSRCFCWCCPFSFIEFFTLTTFWAEARVFTLLATISLVPVSPRLLLFIYFCADFMRLPCDFSAAFCA